MKFSRAAKIILLSFIAAFGFRFAALSVESFREAALTRDLCSLISLPLETGLLREAHEGLEKALKARGETMACVSVTDNGRSYSPDCVQGNLSYHMEMCKAEGNTGVRAAIYFMQPAIFGWPLLFLWAGISIAAVLILVAVESLVRLFIQVFSDEVTRLMGESSAGEKQESAFAKASAWVLHRLGIAEKITKRAAAFREELRKHEEYIAVESAKRVRVEEQAKSSEQYMEKVKQIRHDIRSPLGSLQAIYEQLKVSDAATTKALATAIRRIQLLMDDLNQLDRIREEPKLVIAEVVAEELSLLMAPKFREAKSARLTVEYQAEALSPIMVAEKEFQAALENLLENAFEAISLGGQIRLLIQNEDGQCQISVEDNGCGISPENASKLFSRGGTFGKVNGLGLGLFHTKQNVESWGGKIGFVPLDRGTRFTITIPLMQTGVIFTGLPKDSRLKVIDDDRLVPEALRKAGFEILESASTYAAGREILARGTGEDFSILVDQRLDDDKLGTNLIAQQPARRRIFLCTNDFDDLKIIALARAVGVKIIPKPLCFFRQYQALSAASSLD